MPTLRILLLAAALFAGAAAAPAQTRKPVDKVSDLPSYSYAISGSVEDTIRDPVKFAAFAREYRSNTEATLAAYDIRDKATLRQLLGSLAQLDALEGRDDAALAGFARIRSLQEKPADKLLSGLQAEAVIAVAKQFPDRGSEAFRNTLAARIDSRLEALPYEIVQNDVREMKAGNETASETRAFGYVNEVLQPIVTRSGSLSSEFAPLLVATRYRLLVSLPLKPTLVATYSGYLARHKVVKQDIWAARDVTLPLVGPYTPVNVAVWDSGVDTDLFKNRLVNSGATPAVIAFDRFSQPTTGNLYPLTAAQKARLPIMKARAKGFSDLQSNIDSNEATEVKQYLSALKPGEYKAATEELRMMGNYLHGTHVAGITMAGNPYARLLTARIEFSHTLMPDPCPTPELAERDAAATQAYVDFMKQNGVRVVNMSWGGTLKAVEGELELCGIGKTIEERQKLARGYFDTSRNALTKAFASAPSILFVTSAGNANTDSTFNETLPTDIVLPNLIAVGAVDLAGDEASFTSYGSTVKVHANGYQVESTIPGGERVAESGTSMASPQVANLAAKMLAVNPALTPPELISMIVATADRTPDGRRVLMNPKKAVAAAGAKKAA